MGFPLYPRVKYRIQIRKSLPSTQVPPPPNNPDPLSSLPLPSFLPTILNRSPGIPLLLLVSHIYSNSSRLSHPALAPSQRKDPALTTASGDKASSFLGRSFVSWQVFPVEHSTSRVCNTWILSGRVGPVACAMFLVRHMHFTRDDEICPTRPCSRIINPALLVLHPCLNGVRTKQNEAALIPTL